MSIELKIHAEKFEDHSWNPVSTRIETFSLGGIVLNSWTESIPLFAEKDRGLYRILADIHPEAEAFKPGQRGAPPNISNEVLRASYAYPSLQDENDNVLNQVKQSVTSWLLLDELMAYDWIHQTKVFKGTVESQYADLFGDGLNPYPSECPIKAFYYYPLSQDNKKLHHYRMVSWLQTYTDDYGQIKRFRDEILPTLSTYGTGNSVRIVYWLVP
ncbi:MAG TPA: hypothetical protein V6D19_07715 [Stenomitos sp.]